MNAHVSANAWPALVLNADFRPLSYYPLSLWSWQDAIKAVFLERVNIVAEYDRAVRSPSLEMKLPSVVSLKTFVKPATQPAFTRFNVFLRDKFSCQYCGTRDDLTTNFVRGRTHDGAPETGSEENDEDGEERDDEPARAGAPARDRISVSRQIPSTSTGCPAGDRRPSRSTSHHTPRETCRRPHDSPCRTRA